jgi:F-type H+-transporting ATPase subunit a
VPKRGCLGCSLPLVIGIGIIALALTVIGFLTGSIGRKLFGNIGPDWLQISSPEIQLPPEPIFHISSWPITNTMITAWISILLIIVLSYLAFRRPKMIPQGLQAVMEFVYGSLLSFCQSVAGEKNGRRFFPVVATIFIFVLVNAWAGLLPFYGDAIVFTISNHHYPLLRGANTDLNVTASLALFSFMCIEYYGIKYLGLNYFSKFFRLGQLGNGLKQLFRGKLGPALGSIFFGAIDVVVGILEGLSEFIRIVSFSFRLFGNMMAGEILLLITAFLIPMVFAIPFYGLELLFSFVQALIFGGLTLVFITVAVSSHEEQPS